MSYINDIGYNTAKRRSHLRNLSTQLFLNGNIKVTITDAKLLKSYAEKIITLSKKGTVHARRRARGLLWTVPGKIEGKNRFYNDIILDKLFEDIAVQYKDRTGGFIRIVKIENRRGDNAPMALVMLVNS